MKFSDLNARLMPHFASLVTQWLPSGKREGHEWVSLNPTRNDKKAGSFRINMNTGKWADFATNDNGGDAISLYAYLQGMEQIEAAKELARQEGLEFTPAKPVPKPTTQPTFTHFKHGKPSAVWTYKDANGQPIGSLCVMVEGRCALSSYATGQSPNNAGKGLPRGARAGARKTSVPLAH